MHVVCTCEIPMLTYTSYTPIRPKLRRDPMETRAFVVELPGTEPCNLGAAGVVEVPRCGGTDAFVHHLTCRLFTFFGNISNMYIKLCVYIIYIYVIVKKCSYIFLEIVRDVLWIY